LFSGLKYLFSATIVAVFIIACSYFGITQNSNTRVTEEVKTMLSSASIGDMRDNLSIGGDKKEFVSNLVSNVIKEQKNHGKNIRISYVFLDKNNKPTEDDDSITSVQFKIEYLNDKQEVRSTAEQRLSLNELPQS